MWHKMFKAKKGKKLFMKAFGNMPEGERQEIIDQYMADSKKRKLSVSDSVNIANEEVAAAYAEEIVNHPRDIGGQMEEIRALKAHLRTIRFAVHDADKGDFDAYGGYGEFRKRHMGRLTLANDGVEVDAIYAEMQNQYGLS